MDPTQLIDLITNNPNLSFKAIKDTFGKMIPEDSLKSIFDAIRNGVGMVKSYAADTTSKQAIDDLKIVGLGLATATATLQNLPDIFKSLDGSKGFTEMNQELFSIGDTIDVIQGKGSVWEKISGSIMAQAAMYMQQQSSLIDHMNAKVGLTGMISENFRSEITKASPEVLRMGIGFKDLAEFSGSLVENTGKFLTMSSDDLVRSSSVAQAYVGSLSQLGEMLPEFQKVGIGFRDTVDHIGKVGKDSMEVGLRAQTVTKNIGENIGKLNEYGFKKGVDGLGKMAQKAIEFRTSMSEVFQIADKTMDITDSINMSAELIALGGAVGDFLDPFKLSYMAVNDVGGLQDALLGMSKSLATYNTETNKFEVTGVNLRLARAQAQALGVDMKTLTTSAIAGAERQQVHNDLMARGIVMSKESEQFVTNMSQMKNGSMVVEIGGDLAKTLGTNTVNLETLTQKQFDSIDKMRDDIVKKDETGIIRDQASNVMIMQRDLSFLAALARNAAGDRLSKEAEMKIKETLKSYGFGDDLKDASKKYTDKLAPKISPKINETIDKGKEFTGRIGKIYEKAKNGNSTVNSNSSSNSTTVNNISTPLQQPTQKPQPTYVTVMLSQQINQKGYLIVSPQVKS